MTKLRNGPFKCNRLAHQPLNPEGFTLIEAVVALFVFALCFSLFSIAVKQVETVRRVQQSDRQLEWHLFLNQFEYDIKDFQLEEVAASKITFIKNPVSGEKVTYTRNLQKLLRKVGENGYQPMLMKLRKLTFQLKGTSLIIQAEFTNGEQYQSQISLAEQIKETKHE